jgi:predicted nucleic acid-binding protein
VLVDTSVLPRLLQPEHPLYAVSLKAMRRLRQNGRRLHIVSQNLVELWVVATRPEGSNGLGLAPSAAAAQLKRMQRILKLLPDSSSVFTIWEQLVLEYQVSGKPAHDAHLVAAIRAHSLTTILTFDRDGFTRYQGLEVLDPRDVAAN